MHYSVKKMKVDPIEGVFDKTKTIKKPPMHLKEFLEIDDVEEEVGEVVSFLKNPKIFKEIGAKEPWCVLIVGDLGTWKM